MGLNGLLEEVGKLTRGQAAGPLARPARVLGPRAWPGRGHGIRALDDLLAHLRIVENFSDPFPDPPLRPVSPFTREELAHRLRLVARPFQWGTHFLNSGVSNTWAESPEWYWDPPNPDHKRVEASVSWEAVATTGYLDIRDDAAPSARVGVWPLWLILGVPKLDFHNPILGNYGPLPPGLPQPSVLPDENLRITVLGLVARAWIDWNRVRRVARRGLPLSTWASEELGPFDQQPLRAAVARVAPLEDVHGCIDAVVIGRLKSNSPLSSLLQGYYSSGGLAGAPPRSWHNRIRMQAFFETSPAGSAFHGLALGSPGFAQSLRSTLYPLLHWTLRLLSLLEPWWNHSEIETPWGRAALDMLTDELAALLAEQPSSGFGAWPSAGFGVRRFDATHRPEPMYGQWDLQFGDNDGERRYAGRVRAGDPGGHVAALVADLRELGFTAPVDGTTRFDARVAMAVREFQIEANQVDLSIDRGGVQKVRSPRRYFGRVHGIVDGETRRLIQLWLNRPRVEGDPQPLGPSVDHARNGLLVIACVAQPGPDPLAARPVHPQGSDVWGAMGEPDQPPPGVAGVVQGDDFDFMFLHCRHWAIDRLSRWDPPVAEEPPILANFGPPVPFAGVDAVPLGRYTNAYIGGPSMAFFSRRDHWQSTLLTWNRFQDSPSPDLPPRPEDWRVLYGMTYPETFGYEDVINGYDPALLSIGWSHWTLATHRWEDDPPPLHREADVREMGAMLAWYRHRDPEGFHRDLGQFGLHTPAWGTAAVQFNGPGLHNGRILMWGAGDSNNRLNLVLPQEPDVTQWHLEHTWMRSWRWVYRFLQVARLSTSFRRANREFLLRRIITFLAAPYRGGGFAGEPPPSIGALACSEQAVIALMRWHINLPGYVIRRNGHPGARLREAVDAAANAYRKLPGVPELPDAHAIVVATLADPGNPRAVAFQEKLIEGLLSQTEPIPDPGEPHDPDHVCHPYEGDFGTVRACYAVHNPPAGVPIFRRLPGSYAPPPLPAAWA